MLEKTREIKRSATGVRELDAALSGGFPTNSTILVNGGPGTGKTILALTFLWTGLKAGENAVFVSFGESKKETYANMNAFGMNFKKFEDEWRFAYLEMLSVTGENMGEEISQISAEISAEISKIGAKRVVIDSFSDIAEAFQSEYETRQILQTVVQTVIRALHCTTMIISERPFQTPSGFLSEGFIADGIVTLTEGIPRKMEIHKMRATRILQREMIFTVEDGLDVVRTALSNPSPAKRWKPIILADDRISSGHEDIDAALGGGFSPGTYAVMEAGTNVTFDEIRLLTHGTISNFLAQGLGALYLPPGSADVREVVSDLRNHLRPGDLNALRVVEEVTGDGPSPGTARMAPYAVLLKRGRNDIEADSYTLINALAELKRLTADKPVLRVLSYDTMESKYSEAIPKLHNEIGSAILSTREAGDVSIGVARPNQEILPKVLDMVDWHFKLTKVHDTLLFQSIKPQTITYAVRCDVSKGYRKARLLPMR